MPKSSLDWFAVVSLWVGGLVFAVKSVGVPLFPGTPAFLASNFWNFVPLILVSVSIAIFVYRQLRPVASAAAESPKESELELRTYGDNRTPTGVNLTNVWRWYCLNMQAIDVSDPQQPKTTHFVTSLYITFDKPTVTNNLSITSPDMSLPLHEVKDFNERSAVIVFGGVLGPGTLFVRAHR